MPARQHSSRRRWVAPVAACLACGAAAAVALVPLAQAGPRAGAAKAACSKAKSGGKRVVLDDTNLFTPGQTTIRVGQKIKFTFNGVQTHDVTLTRGPERIGGTHDPIFSSPCSTPTPRSSGTFRRKFNKARTYYFECTLHQPQMDFKLVVKKKKKH